MSMWENAQKPILLANDYANYFDDQWVRQVSETVKRIGRKGFIAAYGVI